MKRKKIKPRRRKKALLQPLTFSKKPWRKIGLYVLLGIICFPFIILFSIKTGIVGNMPDKDQLRSIRNFEASEVYSADHQLLGRYYIQNRIVLDYEHISSHIKDALVATEDERFYQHHGIDFKSLPRVFFKTFLLGDRSGGGGSTITQQLAKNIYHRQQYAVFSMLMTKMREMLIAKDLERIYSKNEILTLYLNTVPFGGNIFGVEAASQQFFSKSAKAINIQEAAVLIGMLKATTYYNPKNNPEGALRRRNVVLAQLHRTDKIGKQELDSLKNLPIELKYKKTDQNDGLATYFREQVRLTLNKLIPQIADSLGESYNLYTDGLKIYTTLDSRLQTFAEKAVYKHMRQLQETFDVHWKGRTKPWENDRNLMHLSLKQSGVTDRLAASGVPADSVNYFMNLKKETEVYSWAGKETHLMSTLDSVKFYLRFLNTGFLSVDPATGEVKAWVGGINHRFFKYDHVNEHSKRQVGSVFKPIVYAAALEQDVSPCEYIEAEQESYREKDKEWKPANADNAYEGKYSLEGALTESVNTVSVKVLEKAGIDFTVALARDMGISSQVPKVPSIALGTPSISLIEMVRAYCTFVNKGKSVSPYFITKIEDKEGRVIWQQAKPKSRPVMSLATSQMMIEMLKNVVNTGTAARLRNTYKLPNDIAGKTGTTQSNADGWFMAMTPELVTGIWVGGEFPAIHFRSTALGQGANMALPIYALFQQQINNSSPFAKLARARFPNPPASVRNQLDCDPFREDVNFWESLFGKKKEKIDGGVAGSEEEGERQYSKKPVPEKEEKGIFKGLKKLFKRKD